MIGFECQTDLKRRYFVYIVFVAAYVFYIMMKKAGLPALAPKSLKGPFSQNKGQNKGSLGAMT